MPINEEQDEITFFVPINYNEPNNIFLGLLNTNRILQIVPLAAPILIIVVLPLLIWVKVILISLIGFLAIFGLMGYKNMGLLDFFSVLYSYIKSPKNYTLPRIDVKGGGYAKTRSRQRRRKNSQEKERKDTKNKKDKKVRKKF